MHAKSSKQVKEFAVVSGCSKSFMRTKGRRSPANGNLVRTKYSGFTVHSKTIVSDLVDFISPNSMVQVQGQTSNGKVVKQVAKKRHSSPVAMH